MQPDQNNTNDTTSNVDALMNCMQEAESLGYMVPSATEGLKYDCMSKHPVNSLD
jgi:hypothetical protein